MGILKFEALLPFALLVVEKYKLHAKASVFCIVASSPLGRSRWWGMGGLVLSSVEDESCCFALCLQFCKLAEDQSLACLLLRL